jgi:hypothetical protein
MAAPAPDPWPAFPYKGLSFYGLEDEPIFAGRARDVRACAALLGSMDVRVLLLHGPTGCGKSSFLRAGLIPYLERRGVSFEFLKTADGGRHRALFVRSTADPLAQLGEAIYDLFKGDHVARRKDRDEPLKRAAAELKLPARPRFLSQFAESPDYAMEVLAKVALPLPRTLVLVLDQAEEVFTLQPGKEADRPRENFFAFLAGFTHHPLDLKLLIAFRTEFYGYFTREVRRHGADEALLNNYLLDELTDDELVQAIERPTLRDKVPGYGVPWEQYRFSYQKGLPQRIVNDLKETLPRGGILPALQIVCSRLYKMTRPDRARPAPEGWLITESAYRQLGSLASQIEGHLEEVLTEACGRHGLGESAARAEIDRWKELLHELVKEQVDGTTTTEIKAEQDLAEQARLLQCKLDVHRTLAFLAEDAQRVVRRTEVVNQQTREPIVCYSLGHDAIGLALAKWKASREGGAPVGVTEGTDPAAFRPPPFRRLRVYALEPDLNAQLEAAVRNELTLAVPWETDPRTGRDLLRPGPVGEYLEVVDYDPPSQCFYEPVDLNAPQLLSQDGLTPSEGNPKFHQQMVYAVAMTTVQRFEHALGRRVLWAPRLVADDAGPDSPARVEYVPRLRLYPHAFREASAYYSPQKKAVLFGYCPAAGAETGGNLPGGLVFSCLSHGVIAHEVTHAVLDGLGLGCAAPSNPDELAFHEAFAETVALFQHFSHPEVLAPQLARVRGDLAGPQWLGELAQQLGASVGHYGALRSALGRAEPGAGRWEPLPPDPTAYEKTGDPHGRAALLVAALFDAFAALYKGRVADLIRIASAASGALPAGELHPDLVQRLARSAGRTADHLARVCTRALDYCPPVDLTFGDFLRALLTADQDLVPDDPRGYRTTLVEAFRRRGLFPRDVRTLSVEGLLWRSPSGEFPHLKEALDDLHLSWDLSADRPALFQRMNEGCARLHYWLREDASTPEVARAMGLALGHDAPATIPRDKEGRPRFEVRSARPALRTGPGRHLILDLIVRITQSRAGYFSPADQERADRSRSRTGGDFTFRGGCTLLINPETGHVRYCVAKSVLGAERLEAQRQFLAAPEEQSLHATYSGGSRAGPPAEPVGLLHRPL